MTPLPDIAIALHEPATPPDVVAETILSWLQDHSGELSDAVQADLARVVTDETWRRAG